MLLDLRDSHARLLTAKFGVVVAAILALEVAAILAAAKTARSTSLLSCSLDIARRVLVPCARSAAALPGLLSFNHTKQFQKSVTLVSLAYLSNISEKVSDTHVTDTVTVRGTWCWYFIW